MLLKATFAKIQRQTRQIKITFVVDINESELDFETLEGMPGYLIFQGKPITKEVQKAIDNKFLGASTEGKSWSQKLRGTLLNLWNKSKSILEMDEFYANEMDRINEHYKTKLKSYE